LTKYIFVTGGVVSSLGKGLASACIGCLLESRGLKVTIQKLDPYINVDPGTMNPYQHGEVYVLEDGAETDLDLGHYERFTNAMLDRENNYTTGRIYNNVITKERRGDYLGGTIQVIPHITNEIQDAIQLMSTDREVDVAIIEIGGTVGDIESLPYLEAIRQFPVRIGKENCLYIHLTLIPYIKAAGEAKTKPTQHSVNKLREIGIQPDIILCRTERDISDEARAKIGLFCNIDTDAVIQASDVDNIYKIPIVYAKQNLDTKIIKLLKVKPPKPRDLSAWEALRERIENTEYEVNIAVVGKYIELQDAYKSIYESLAHGGFSNWAKVNIHRIEAGDLEDKGPDKILAGLDAILVPGGFGYRGIEGKILAAKYARENKIPYLGICLGMQCAVIEVARNLAGLKNANSSEFDTKTPYPVIDLMESQMDVKEKGGTMRLGAYACCLTEGSKAFDAYKKEVVFERHRHRWEFNLQLKKQLSKAGLRLSGISPNKKLVEIVELKDHPWYVGCQFHPEFKSRPLEAHPLFREFVRAAIAYHEGVPSDKIKPGARKIARKAPKKQTVKAKVKVAVKAKTKAKTKAKAKAKIKIKIKAKTRAKKLKA
jgi:CTP synthase